MKNLMIAALLLCVPVLFCGSAPKANPKEAAKQLEQLKSKQREVAEEMYKLRLDLIKNDSELQRLHQQIIALYKELALRIDSRREMRMLIARHEELQKEISQLQAQTAK